MSSLKSQFRSNIKGRLVYGVSKHNASDEDRAKNIYSTSTRDNYIKHTDRFVSYLKSEGLHASNVAEARQFVPQYIENCKENNISAWTIHSAASALAKVYDCSSKDFGVELPRRARSEIVRDRSQTDYSKHFSEIRHHDIVAFAKSTGLRRYGLEHIRGKDISVKDNGDIIIHTKEKGGRERELLLYNKDKAIYEEARQIALRAREEPEEKIFGKISKAAQLHAYRADYAKGLYDHLAKPLEELSGGREIYQCRNEYSDRAFDRAALEAVTQYMGHNRCNVTVNNYLL